MEYKGWTFQTAYVGFYAVRGDEQIWGNRVRDLFDEIDDKED